MPAAYDPKTYWEHRLSKHFTLQGVGHISYSENYNRWLYRRNRRCLEQIFANVDLHGSDVLDVGCGNGFFVRWYMSQGARVFGLDITETAIKALPVEGQIADISASDYDPPRRFDIVNMWGVIYHIVDDERFERALANVAQSLKPQGTLLLTDWFGAPADRSAADHVRLRCLRTYDRIMPRCGFRLTGLFPLYNHLNRRTFPRVDNLLGRVYFHLDNRNKTIPANNTSLALWEFSG